MISDGVSHGHVIPDDARGAVGREHTDPAFCDLGGVEVSQFVEGQIVGADNPTTHGADRLDIAAVGIDGADLAARNLGDVDSSIRARPQSVRAVETGGRRQAVERPALHDDGVGWRSIAARLLLELFGAGDRRPMHHPA